MVRLRRLIKGRRRIPAADLPELPSCTVVVAAYNEEDIITGKIRNTLALNYPQHKLEFLFISDGSTDRTPELIAKHPEIRLMHQPCREGKIAAIHRAVSGIKTEVIVFTDANTFLNKNALINICRHYMDDETGAVAGEKRIHTDLQSDASSAGEGFYWKYESALKKWDSELYSVAGAAGELFSIRQKLYQPVPADTILDDFMISMLIAQQGYRIVYEPDAYAVENASENITQELKRKIRIAAGGIQAIIRLRALLNICRYGFLSFQYISHRVLRWTVTPFLLIACFIMNIMLATDLKEPAYQILLTGQVLFYLLAFIGYFLEKKRLSIKILFIPYYFCVMNYAVIAGISRYFSNRQSAAWEKARRKN